MTVSTSTNSVVYRGNGATTQFAVPFKVLDVDHLRVRRRVYATGAFNYTYTGTEFSYSGLGDDAGTLTLVGVVLADTYDLVIERIVSYTQDLDLVNAGGFYPETVEEQLDLIVMGLQQLADLAERAAVVPVGEDGIELSKSADRASKFFAFDANGNFLASAGTGSDSALRTDLATSSGGVMVGTTRGTLQAVLDALAADTLQQQLAWPPFAAFAVSEVIPNANQLCAAVRYDARTFMMRQLMAATGFIEEFTFHRVDGYAGVDDGWELIGWRTITPLGVFPILIQPINPDFRTNTHFAFRFGKAADTDVATAANVNGYGHGNMTAAAPVLKLDNTGADLTETAGWAVGVGNALFGDGMVDTTTFKLLTPDDSEGVTLVYTQDINTTFGLRQTGVMTAEMDVKFRDSPSSMHAVNRGPLYEYFDTAKLSGEASEVTLDGTGGEINLGPSTTAEYYQFYNAAAEAAGGLLVVPTMRSRYRAIQDFPGETLDPYEWCDGPHVLLLDNADFSKFAGYAQSTSTSSDPSQALANTEQLIFDNMRYSTTALV